MKPIQTLIDEALKTSNEVPRKRSGKWSPSMFGRCIRAQVWNRSNEPKTDEVEERVLRVFKAGKLFHDFVQDTIVKTDPSIEVEVKCETDDALGYADIVNGEAVYDLKTVHSGAFHYMKDDISESKKPNILQVMFYVSVLNKKTGTLVFISKDDLCLKEYSFILNERWDKEVSDELSTLRYAWECLNGSGKLPEAKPRAYIDSKGKCKECGYCSWKSLCDKKEAR